MTIEQIKKAKRLVDSADILSEQITALKSWIETYSTGNSEIKFQLRCSHSNGGTNIDLSRFDLPASCYEFDKKYAQMLVQGLTTIMEGMCQYRNNFNKLAQEIK